MRYGLGVGIVALVGVASHAGVAQTDCESARCAVQTAIDQNCSCTAATNHGQYVSCVAHQVKQLSRAGQVPTNCKGKVTRCAARSVCGKTGFVTCLLPIDSCDTTTGTCASNPAIPCTTALDCGSKCHTKSSATLCTAAGGTVGGGSTCCAACVTTP